MLPGTVPALFGGVPVSPGNDQYTVLLCHFDGPNSSTIIVDSSPAKHGTATVAGPAYLAAGGIIGGAALVNAANAYITFPNSADWEFGAGDFTVDWWEYRNAAAGCSVARDLSTTYCPFFLHFGSNGEIYMTSTGSSWDIANGAAGLPSPSFGPATLSVWNHFAVTRQGNTFRAFKNGVQKSTWTSALALKSNTNPLCIGAAQTGQNVNSYMDELRISKGIARWTANFTPPTKPYGPDPDTFTKLLLHFDGTNGSTVALDSSQYVRGGVTATGTAKLSNAQSKFGGSCAYYPGTSPATGGWWQYPDNPDWNFGTNDFTIEAWMYPTSLATDSTIAMHLNGGTDFQNAWKFVVRATDKIIRFVHSQGGTNIIQLQSVNPAVVNVWTHIAAVRSGNNTALYINGIAEATGTFSGAIPAVSGPLNIGTGDASGNAFFSGYIDEFRISNGSARWTANFTPPAAPYLPNPDLATKLLMHFDGLNGTVDSSRSGRGYPTNTAVNITGAQSKFGDASALFNGTSSWLTYPSSPDFDFASNDFTIDCWVYLPARSSVDSGIVSRMTSGAFGDRHVFKFNAAGQLRFDVVSATTGLISFSGVALTPIPLNTWSHVAIVRSGSTFTVYLNGIADGSVTYAGAIPVISTTLFIGTIDPSVNWMNGYIDELRFSNGVARWTANFTPPAAPYTI